MIDAATIQSLFENDGTYLQLHWIKAMTPQEWIDCNDPVKMIGLIANERAVRKLRLKTGVLPESSMVYLSREVTDRKLRLFTRELLLDRSGTDVMQRTDKAIDVATELAASVSNPRYAANLLREIFGIPFPGRMPAWEDGVLYDVSYFDGTRRIWEDMTQILAWNSGAIPKMAQAIFDDNAFGDLPILADLMEEAGRLPACRFVEHFRSDIEYFRTETRHCRGCWATDLLLNKG